MNKSAITARDAKARPPRPPSMTTVSAQNVIGQTVTNARKCSNVVSTPTQHSTTERTVSVGTQFAPMHVGNSVRGCVVCVGLPHSETNGLSPFVSSADNAQASASAKCKRREQRNHRFPVHVGNRALSTIWDIIQSTPVVPPNVTPSVLASQRDCVKAHMSIIGMPKFRITDSL